MLISASQVASWLAYEALSVAIAIDVLWCRVIWPGSCIIFHVSKTVKIWTLPRQPRSVFNTDSFGCFGFLITHCLKFFSAVDACVRAFSLGGGGGWFSCASRVAVNFLICSLDTSEAITEIWSTETLCGCGEDVQVCRRGEKAPFRANAALLKRIRAQRVRDESFDTA